MSLALIGLHFVQLEKVTSNNQGTKMLKISTCRTRYILQCCGQLSINDVLIITQDFQV